MRFMRFFVLLLASNIFLLQTAFSSNLTWTINNHSYEYGGYLTGSFDFDADTGAFSNIDITSHTQFDFTHPLLNKAVLLNKTFGLSINFNPEFNADA